MQADHGVNAEPDQDTCITISYMFCGRMRVRTKERIAKAIMKYMDDYKGYRYDRLYESYPHSSIGVGAFNRVYGNE